MSAARRTHPCAQVHITSARGAPGHALSAIQHKYQLQTQSFRAFVTQATEGDEEDELFAVGSGTSAPQAAPRVAPLAVAEAAPSAAAPTPAAGPASSLLSDHEQAEALFDVPSTANGAAGERNSEGTLGLGARIQSQALSMRVCGEYATAGSGNVVGENEVWHMYLVWVIMVLSLWQI